MIHGAHVILYSKDAEADRAFFRDVLKYPFADAGHGWLIFALPPAEVAMHPGEKNDVHELYLMCEDVERLIADMQGHAIACAPVENLGWGLRTQVTLPGGGRLGVYQPRHERPPQAAAARATARAPRRRAATKAPKRAAKKAARGATKKKSARIAKKPSRTRSPARKKKRRSR